MAISSLSTLVAAGVIVSESTPAVVADTAILNVVIMFASVLLRFGADRLMVPEVRLAAAITNDHAREAGAKILSASVVVLLVGVPFLVFTPILPSIVEVSLSSALSHLERLALATWLASEVFRLVVAEGHRAFDRYGRAAATGPGLRGPVFLVLLVTWSWWHSSLGREAVVVVAAVASTTVSILALVTISKKLPWWRTWPLSGLKSMWRSNSLMLITTLAGTAVGGVHVWIAGAAFGSADVAVYSFANTLVSGLAIVTTAINGGLSPRIASLVVDKRFGDVQKLTSRFVRGAVALSLFALVGLLVAGPAVSVALGGEAYEGIWVYILVLGAGQVASAAGGLSGWVLMASRRYRVVALSSACVALGMVMLCIASAVVVESILALAFCAALGTAMLPIANNVVSSRTMGVRTDVLSRGK